MNGICSDMSYGEFFILTTGISNACRECSSHIKKGSETEGEVFKSNLADLFLSPLPALACITLLRVRLAQILRSFLPGRSVSTPLRP